MLGILAVLGGLALLIYLALRGASILVVSLVCAGVVALGNGLPLAVMVGMVIGTRNLQPPLAWVSATLALGCLAGLVLFFRPLKALGHPGGPNGSWARWGGAECGSGQRGVRLSGVHYRPGRARSELEGRQWRGRKPRLGLRPRG